MKLKRAHIIELLICIAICIVPFVIANAHVQSFTYIETLFPENKYENAIDTREIHHGVSVVEYNELLSDVAGGKYYNKRFDMPNGDVVISGSLRGKTDEGVVIETLHIDGEANIHILDNGQATNESLAAGDYDASLIIIDSNSFDIACYTPKQYKYLEKEALEYYPDKDGYISVKEAEGGFDIEIVTPAVEETSCADFMLVYSEGNLVDFGDDASAIENEWLSFTMDSANRWTYRGHYRLSDPSYRPTGENVYARNVACYFGRSFGLAQNRYRLMDDMLCCILETMSDVQDEKGYFASMAESTRLQDSFSMFSPYYDTRFNSDLMEVFILGYQLYQSSTSYDVINNYLDYFFWFAESYGIDDGNGGLWIPDYWAEKSDMSTVPTSLNHQLSEIIVLYKVGRAFGRTDCTQLADKMLMAVKNTADAWIKEDGSLHYAIYQDGHFGDLDYPCLTYNDLFNLQTLLVEMGRDRDVDLDRIMAAKLVQMQRDGISGYLQ